MNKSLIGGLIVGVVVGVVAALVVIGLKRKEGLRPPTRPTAAVAVPVTVVAESPGANPETVYLNYGDSIMWTAGASGVTFTVDIPGQSPFSASHFPPGTTPGSTASSGPVMIKPTASYYYLSFKYRVTVTTSNGTTQVFDPHVIIMGN